MMPVAFPEVEESECPNCKSLRNGRRDSESGVGFRAMSCPSCTAEFCGNCFRSLPESDGNVVQCPKCWAVLELDHLTGWLKPKQVIPVAP